MKKLLTVAAIGAASAVPIAAMSDTTLYGQLRYSFNSVDEDGAGSDIDGFRGDDNVSLFGLKGSYGDSVKAFFHLQTGARADSGTGGASGNAFDQRFYFGGLSGKFGKVAYGRMTNAYKFPGFKLDPFYNWSSINVNGVYSEGAGTYGLSPGTNGFTDNSLQYTTPAFFGGLKLLGGVYIDDSNDDDEGYIAGASWEGKSFDVGVVYGTNGDNTATLPGIAVDGDGVRAYGTYKADRWSVSVSYENVDITVPGGDESVNYLYVPVQFNVTDKVRLALAPGFVDDGPAEGKGITAGAFWTVAPHTELVLSGSYVDRDDDDKPSVFTVGAIHKF